MGKMNIAFLYARVSKRPIISKNAETGEYNYGMVYLDTVRSLRSVEDGTKYVRHDYPLIMSMDKEILDKISEWQENDIVFVKGVITTKMILKTTHCPECLDDDGSPHKNQTTSNLVYITPIYVRKLASYGDDKNGSIEDVVNNREISNQVYVLGTLIRDPKMITTKKKIQITQYPIALNRKYTIRTDDPAIKTDWPIVKTYGENARNDKVFLRYQAEIMVDGFLQARTVQRHCVCGKCGKDYIWPDHLLELVPYETEYISGHRTEDNVRAETQKSVEQVKQMLFQSGFKDELDDELKSDDTTD